ncbi:MAG: hypothetical protein RL701_5119 [Pseudomonadota bacterium]
MDLYRARSKGVDSGIFKRFAEMTQLLEKTSG